MTAIRTRLRYLICSSTKAALQKGFDCPSCGARNSDVVDSKFLVTQLRRCESCRLLFRAPTTSPDEAARFYQNAYEQGFTTTLPSVDEVKALQTTHFASSEKSFSAYIDMLRALGVPAAARVLDYGCSWGYGTWQLRDAGFDVQGFEISRPRCAFARDALHVDATWSLEDLRGPFDVVFSSHVLEHIPSIRHALDHLWSLLRPDGLLVAITPNGAAAFRARSPAAWSKLWGYVHPNLLDDVFYRHHFRAVPLLLASNPYPLEAIAKWRGAAEPQTCDLSGGELACVARKTDAVA